MKLTELLCGKAELLGSWNVFQEELGLISHVKEWAPIRGVPANAGVNSWLLDL